eukprot:1602764-Amphidinium_carterae.1
MLDSKHLVSGCSMRIVQETSRNMSKASVYCEASRRETFHRWGAFAEYPIVLNPTQRLPFSCKGQETSPGDGDMRLKP